jgi:hypothetical protein
MCLDKLALLWYMTCGKSGLGLKGTAMGDTPSLSVEQLEAMSLLLAGATRQDAAAALGVGERTIANWKRQDAWKEQWDERVGSRLDHVCARLDAALERRITDGKLDALEPKEFLDWYTRIRRVAAPTAGPPKMPTSILQIITSGDVAPVKLQQAEVKKLEAEIEGRIIDVECEPAD